jgi:hypothetical protein
VKIFIYFYFFKFNAKIYFFETAYYAKYTRERHMIFDEKINSLFMNKNIQFRYFFIKKTFYDFYIWIFQGFKYIFVNVLILDRILDIIFSFFLEKFV